VLLVSKGFAHLGRTLGFVGDTIVCKKPLTGRVVFSKNRFKQAEKGMEPLQQRFEVYGDEVKPAIGCQDIFSLARFNESGRV
jgi:hypothetical protein